MTPSVEIDLNQRTSEADSRAHSIYQNALDGITNAFWAKDWVALGNMIAFPNRISSPDAEREIDTVEEWLELAWHARQNFADLGATEYHRICKAAVFSDEAQSRIRGIHTTYIMRGSTLAMPPFQSYLSLRLCRDGIWRSDGLHTEQRDSVLPSIHADRLTQRT